jgi:hypothetical protein
MSHLTYLPMSCTKNNDLKVYKQQGPQQNPPAVQGHIHRPLTLLLATTTLTFITQLTYVAKSMWGKLIAYRCMETESAASSASSHIQSSRKATHANAVWRIVHKFDVQRNEAPCRSEAQLSADNKMSLSCTTMEVTGILNPFAYTAIRETAGLAR